METAHCKCYVITAKEIPLAATIDGTKQKCIKRYTDNTGFSWEKLCINGFDCVPVDLTIAQP